MTIVDVAGVAIAIQAGDDARREALLDALAGFPATSTPPVTAITIDRAPHAVPDVAPRAEDFGFRFWDAPDGVVASAKSAVLEVSVHGAALHIVDDDDLDVVEPADAGGLAGRVVEGHLEAPQRVALPLVVA